MYELQVLYHRGWCQAIEMAMSGLNASLLILHPSDPSQYVVNIDPQIIELIQEAKYLQKMNLEVIGSALVLMSNEERIRKTREMYVALDESAYC
jgi:dynein heavy chain, axonemal